MRGSLRLRGWFIVNISTCIERRNMTISTRNISNMNGVLSFINLSFEPCACFIIIDTFRSKIIVANNKSKNLGLLPAISRGGRAGTVGLDENGRCEFGSAGARVEDSAA
jgi:hypothetical protein